MGDYSQPDFSIGDDSSSLGMGGRRRGLFQTLLGLGQNSQQPWDERMPTGSQRQPRLVDLMNGISTPGATGNLQMRHASGYQSGQHPTGAPEQLEPHVPPPPGPIPNDQTRSTVPQARFSRIEDDPQSRQHIAALDEGTADLESRIGTTAGPSYRPAQPEEHMQQLESRYQTEANYQPKPLSLVQKIALGATAPFGSLGAFQDERDRQQQMHQANARSLLQEIEADKRINTQEDLATQRMTLQQQMQRDTMLKQEQLERDKEQAAALRTPFGAWQAQNPSGRVDDWLKLEQSNKAPAGSVEDEGYRQITSALTQGQPVSLADQSWAHAYERQKTLGPAASASAADARLSRQQQFQIDKEARGQINAAEKQYRQAKESADALGDFIDLASKGNKIAGAAVPLEGTLEIVTSQGVKRINRTEVEGIEGAGSLFDRIQSKVGKWVKGQPMPADLLRDFKALNDTMRRNSYRTYSDAYDQAKDTYSAYGTDFNKIKKLPTPGNELKDQIKQRPAPGMVRFQDSQGGVHDIPSGNLKKARQRDPGLQVLSQ